MFKQLRLMNITTQSNRRCHLLSTVERSVPHFTRQNSLETQSGLQKQDKELVFRLFDSLYCSLEKTAYVELRFVMFFFQQLVINWQTNLH